jgi:sec-independent protein translocase protein TatA
MTSVSLIFGDIAASEVLLIMFFVLILFGSKSIPGIARSLGRAIRQIKDASNEVQSEIKKSTGDIRTDFNLQRMMDDTRSEIEKPFQEHARTLDQAMNFEPPRQFVQPQAPSEPADQPMDQPEAPESQPEEAPKA